MYPTQPYPQTIHEYPYIPHCRDFSSNLGPECPSLEEDDEEVFHRNVSHPRHTSLLTPSQESQSPSLSSSPAAMFLSSFMTSQQSSPEPDEEGQIISGYTLGDVIGYGATSIIRRGWSVSGGVVAVKIVRRADLVKAGNAPQARKRLQYEASVWSTLSHEHILPLFSSLHTSHADYFFTLYCPAGSLFDILKRDGRPALAQDEVGMMFRQIVRGLRYLHETSQLVHRDMKLENVLVDEMGMCRIGDFGMSRNIGSEDSEDEDLPTREQYEQSDMGNFSVHRAVSLTSKKHLGNAQNNHVPRHRNSTSSTKPIHPLQPGSLPYAAPELLLPQTSDVLHPHPRQDIWALGVMLYTLLTGRLPFSDSFEPRLQMKILNGVYTVPTDIGRGAERILQGCLERNISTRWNIAMVDDVAWGVGCGAEGDGATPTNDEPSSSLERGCARQLLSRSPSVSSAPSTPNDAQLSPITCILEHPDEFQLDSSARGRSAIRSSLDGSDAKSVQRTARFEDGIADWTAHQDMETIDGDDDTESQTLPELTTTVTVSSDRQQQQRCGSLPRPSLRWTRANNSTSYLGFTLSPSNLSRSRSAEHGRYFG